MTAQRTPLRLAIASICLAAATITGCLEDNELSDAIDEVAMKLESLGAPGTAVPGRQLRSQTYSNAISTLKPLVGEGSPEQQAAAWLLIARSEFGLAADPAADAADARRQAATRIQAIRSELSTFRDLAALAAAAESFDPAEEIAEIQAKISERVESAGQVQTEMAGVREEIAEFEALADEASAASETHRNAEAELRTQIMSMSAQEALPLVRQAAEQRSRADEFAAEADIRVAQADVLRPRITEFQGELDRLAEQQRLLEESIESLNAERESTAENARAYRARAAEVAARIADAVREADAFRSGTLTETYDQAVAALETAAASARKATSARTTSRLLSGEIAQTLGGTALAHAETLQSMADVAREAVAEAGVRDSSITAIESSLRSAADEARATGTEALRGARDDFEGAGVRGENADRVDGIVASINEILGEPDQPADDALQDDPADEGQADETQPDETQPDDSDPAE